MKNIFKILKNIWYENRKDVYIFLVIFGITKLLGSVHWLIDYISVSSLSLKNIIASSYQQKILADVNTILTCMPITIFFGLWWNHGDLSLYLARVFHSVGVIKNKCSTKIIDRNPPRDIVQIFLVLALLSTYASILKNINVNNILNLRAELPKYICYALPYVALLKYSKISIKRAMIYVFLVPLLFVVSCWFFHLYVPQNQALVSLSFLVVPSLIVLKVFSVLLFLSQYLLHLGYYKMIPEIRRIWNGKKCSNSPYLYTIACALQPILQIIILRANDPRDQ
jgi:hypothetical protein